MKKTGMIIALVVAALVAFTGCSLLDTVGDIAENPETVFFSSEDGEATVTRSEDPDHITFVSETKPTGEVTINGQKYAPKENVINVLLIGVDNDAYRTQNSMGWRSDMLMLATVNFDDNSITLTSTPRDTKTTIYKLDDNGNISDTMQDKIAHAYAYGGGPTKYSAENAMRVTSEFFEVGEQVYVPIDYYISIDLDGVIKLADSLGGVSVVLDQSVPEVGGTGETVNLTGIATRRYLENRKDMNDGETDRQRHEQTFMMALLQKIKGMGAVESAPELYDAFLKYMRTNMSLEQVVAFAAVVDNMDMNSLKLNVFTEGTSENTDAWYYIPNEDEILNMMLDALYNKA